jgi:hypothetical protein
VTARLPRPTVSIASCGQADCAFRGQDQPSPSIADALHGGCGLLEVQFRHCNHAPTVDLVLVIWPRERTVHTIRRTLYCAQCEKSRQRVNAGLARAREKGTALGRPYGAGDREAHTRPCRARAFSRSVARRASAPASCNASFRQCRASAAPQLTHAFELIALLVRLL